MVDLLDERVFRRKLEANLLQKNRYLADILKEKEFGFSEIFEEYCGYRKKIERYVKDTSLFLYEASRKRRKILFEGAQGALLDLDHGTYPFVTSSNTVAGNACAGSGLGPTMMDSVIGVTKAYTTRVGEGPFPTELQDEVGQKIREKGGEYGATTGRPRRCGWLDAIVVNHAIRINGIRELAITKLDVLNDFDEIKICTAYRLAGRTIDQIPTNPERLAEAEPVYETLDGWNSDIRGVREFSTLPRKAQKYLRRIERLTRTKIGMVSTGSERNETIGVRSPFGKKSP
jgi:adenylosuccinate synthase